MAKALLNPKMISWARERAGLEIDDLVEAVHPNFHLWESGEDKPTFKQAQKLAKKLHVPFAYLFLKKIPQEKPLVADLRTIGDYERDEYSVDLKDVLMDARNKQDWYKEYLIQNGYQELEFLGKFNLNSEPAAIARSIAKTLDWDLTQRQGFSKSETLRRLIEATENAGIAVLKNGKVGTNTHRILDVQEFRGLALFDPIAPLIFINAADAEAAQIFTLAHELAHLWIGQEGVSNVSLGQDLTYSREEKFCNEVAAEFLVPENELLKVWDKSCGLVENAEKLAGQFKVSRLVVARRAFDLTLVKANDFFEYFKELQRHWKSLKKNRGSGGSFNNSLPVANSKSITRAIIAAVNAEKVLLRNGARLLGLNPLTFDKYIQNMSY